MTCSRQDDARSYAESLTDDRLRGFAYDQERLDAKLIAALYQSGHVKAASEVLAVVGDWPRVLPLVINELKGKRTKTDITTSGLNIIRAYAVACASEFPPTLNKVKTEYVRLIVNDLTDDQKRRPKETDRAWLLRLEQTNTIPHHKTFPNVLKRIGGPYREERGSH